MKFWTGAAAIMTATVATSQAFAQTGDASRGQRLYNQQCRACHTLEQGGASPAGPNLHGLFGRKAGTAPGYEFSDAMKKSGIAWDETTLAEYTRDPKAKVPDTKMVYGGMKQPAQLADLLAYLKQATQ
ncbi:MAG TPA: cytochrome c family protein [Reyranella sp.]|nr:cytochrome c family protein [Reyranella sp.]